MGTFGNNVLRFTDATAGFPTEFSHLLPKVTSIFPPKLLFSQFVILVRNDTFDCDLIDDFCKHIEDSLDINISSDFSKSIGRAVASIGPMNLQRIEVSRPPKVTLNQTQKAPESAGKSTDGAEPSQSKRLNVLPLNSPAGVKSGNTGVQEAMRRLNTALSSPDILDEKKVLCAARLVVNLSKIVNDNLLTIKVDKAKFQEAWKDHDHASEVKAAVAASLDDLGARTSGTMRDIVLSGEQKAPVMELTGNGVLVVTGPATRRSMRNAVSGNNPDGKADSDEVTKAKRPSIASLSSTEDKDDALVLMDVDILENNKVDVNSADDVGDKGEEVDSRKNAELDKDVEDLEDMDEDKTANNGKDDENTKNAEKGKEDDDLVDTEEEKAANNGNDDGDDDNDSDDDDDDDDADNKKRKVNGSHGDGSSRSGGSTGKDNEMDVAVSENASQLFDVEAQTTDNDGGNVTKETDCSNEGCEIDDRVPLDEDHRCTACEYNYFHDGGCCKVITIENSTFKMCIPCCDNGERIEKAECANPNCKVKDILITCEATRCPFCDKYCHFDCFLSVIDQSKTTTHACPSCVKDKDLELILVTTRDENKVKGKKSVAKKNTGTRKSTRKRKRTSSSKTP